MSYKYVIGASIIAVTTLCVDASNASLENPTCCQKQGAYPGYIWVYTDDPCEAYTDNDDKGHPISRIDASSDKCAWVWKNGKREPDPSAGGTYTVAAPLGSIAQQEAAAGE